ncbi:MAG: hypothetical protein HQK94_16665 [Nitrospirae bacterium]|nr:hypothetical protein [Nitrospirota bacterium]
MKHGRHIIEPIQHAIKALCYYAARENYDSFQKINISVLSDWYTILCDLENKYENSTDTSLTADENKTIESFRDTIFYRLDSIAFAMKIKSIFKVQYLSDTLPSYIGISPAPESIQKVKAYIPHYLIDSLLNEGFIDQIYQYGQPRHVNINIVYFNNLVLLLISYEGRGYEIFDNMKSAKSALKSFLPFSNIFILTSNSNNIFGCELIPSYNNGIISEVKFKKIPEPANTILFGMNNEYALTFLNKTGGTAYLFMFPTVNNSDQIPVTLINHGDV